MLTAKLQNGIVISLVDHYSRKQLDELRKQEVFYCRGCSQRVILKLGTKRIFHFAHEKGAMCTEDYDRESEYHMQGKMKLFNWLKAQGLAPELECYFPRIRQRADIAFTYDGKIYCLEYQCSTISEEQFMKRTENYYRAKLSPIWILGGKNIQRIGPNKALLTNFHYLFLRDSVAKELYLPAYCPQSNVFITLTNIIPITARKCYCHFSITGLSNFQLTELLSPTSSPSIKMSGWKDDLLKYKTQLLMNASLQNPFLSELYSRSLNPYYIPPYVGLPLKLNIAIETPPFIWQTYVFLDFLYQQSVGKEVYFPKVYTAILSRERKSQLKTRKTPSVRRNLVPFAVESYLNALEKAGILKKLKKHQFVIDKSIIIANNMDNWVRQQEQFYLAYLKG